jgi:hypothetical protein
LSRRSRQTKPDRSTACCRRHWTDEHTPIRGVLRRRQRASPSPASRRFSSQCRRGMNGPAP